MLAVIVDHLVKHAPLSLVSRNLVLVPNHGLLRYLRDSRPKITPKSHEWRRLVYSLSERTCIGCETSKLLQPTSLTNCPSPPPPTGLHHGVRRLHDARSHHAEAVRGRRGHPAVHLQWAGAAGRVHHVAVRNVQQSGNERPLAARLSAGGRILNVFLLFKIHWSTHSILFIFYVKV